MRIPSQTVQSEDDVEKSNHDKDPIFKDNTSKGTSFLLCLKCNQFKYHLHMITSSTILDYSIFSKG